MMAETQEGGLYAVKKGMETVFVDANGKEAKQVKQESSETPQEPKATYPYADLLTAGGLKDWEAVKGATDEQLNAIGGIGPARVAEIRAYKP